MPTVVCFTTRWKVTVSGPETLISQAVIVPRILVDRQRPAHDRVIAEQPRDREATECVRMSGGRPCCRYASQPKSKALHIQPLLGADETDSSRHHGEKRRS